jgi:hypothetical protein
MPRRKTLDDTASTPVETSTPDAAPLAKKPSRSRKASEGADIAPEPKAKRTRKQPQAAQPAPVEPESSQPAEALVAETKPATTPKKPKKTFRSVISWPEERPETEQAEPPGSDAPEATPAAADDAELQKTTKPARKVPVKSPSKAVAAGPPIEEPVAEKPAKPKRTAKATKSTDWLSPEFDLPEPIWRPIAAKPAPKVAPKPWEPVVSDDEDLAEAESDEAEAGATSPADDDGTRRRRRRRRRARKPGEPEIAADTSAEFAESEPVDVDPEELAEAEAELRPSFRPRSGRSGSPRGSQPSVNEPGAPVSPFPTPVVPPAPVRMSVEIPSDAPQVVLRDGLPILVRNHQVYPPLFFFGSPSDERRSATVFDELRMAAEAGVHLHSFLIDLEIDEAHVDAAAQLSAYLLSKAVQTDPQAQVLFRVALQAPRGWEDRYPRGRFREANGELAEPSVCDDEFWNVAERCLRTFTQKLRLLDQRAHILGMHLDRGEWFHHERAGYDTSPAAKEKYREWARKRYLNDEVTFRASWFDGSVGFDSITIPEYRPEGVEGERFIRSSRKQRRYVDYHLFLSDATVERIGALAYAVKEASEGYFLIGVSYGYTFEWSHPSSGHLSLGKLLRTPEIDFLAGPPSYRSREPGGSAPFPCPVDSLPLNGKLYISEEDFKTSLSQGQEPDDFNPPLRTPQALEAVHWRGAGAAAAHGAGASWMDLWGNGWLRSAAIWDRAAKIQEALIRRMAAPVNDPDVAVFIDERSLAYLVDENAFALLVQNVRESVLRAGVSAGFYLLSDLQHREVFPESKLYIFLNAWDIRPELRAAIKTRLQRDNKVLFWLYTAGLFDAGRDSLERAREVTGIALKPQPFYSKSGTTVLNRRHPLSEAFPDRSVIGGTKLEPSYFAIPENATVLGEYTQTGLPSFVVREFNQASDGSDWTSVFLGEPLVNPALIRALANLAGAHVWNFQGDLVHVREPFLTVHCAGAGPRTIALPDKYSAFNLVTRQWAAVDSTNLRFMALDGSTHAFMIGLKTDLEHYLNRPPADILRIDTLPPREANVIGDISNFDVPIMKLGEWMEMSDSDDVADDWFLRAPKEVVEEEQATEDFERPGSRRRRRRRGRGGRGDRGDQVGSEEVVTARREPGGAPESDGDDLGMNVVFRKRE